MPSHIFTRLGFWEEATTTNEHAWRISNEDVKAAGEPGTLRDFHSLNYLSYNYIQLGRYKDAKKTVECVREPVHGDHQPSDRAGLAGDAGSPRARPDDLALPDRVLWLLDTLARFIVESQSWSAVANRRSIATSSDFVVMKLHLEVMAAAATEGRGRGQSSRRLR